MSEHVELIREAARLIRERAEAATPGPWESLDGGDRLIAWKLDPSGQFDDDWDYVVDEPIGNSANAEHIASWHPGVALLVADWLELEADMAAKRDNSAEGQTFHALALARAYLGNS